MLTLSSATHRCLLFAAFALVAAAGTNARADLIPLFDGTSAGTGTYAGDTVFHYHVSLSTGSSNLGGSGPNDYVTIYDFAGYVVGSASVVSSTGTWAISEQLTGLTPPLVAPPDNPSLLNISFTYTTPTLITGTGQTVLTFDLVSTVSQVAGVFTPYSGSSTNVTNNTVQGNVGFVAGPNPVPEPSAVALMGLGCLAVAAPYLRRKVRHTA